MRCSSILLLTFVISCSSGPSPELLRLQAEARADSIHYAKREDVMEKQRALLKNFEWDSDPSINAYCHVYWDSVPYGQNEIRAYVSNDDIYLMSCLVRKTGEPQHNRIDLVIGNSVFTSGKNGIAQVCTPQNGEELQITTFRFRVANDLSSTIAQHLKDTVEVRTFFNDHEYESYILSYPAKKVIYDCVELNRIDKEMIKLSQ